MTLANYIVKRLKKKFKKLSKLKKILLGILGGIVLLIVSGVVYSQYLLWQTREQLPDLERTIDKYITYESNREHKKAYDLFIEEYRNYDSLETFIKKSEYMRPGVAGYMRNSLIMNDFSIKLYLGQPIHMIYEGDILYEDRDQGQVEAVFLLKNGKWELYSVVVSAPQSRFDKFTPPQEKITPTP